MILNSSGACFIAPERLPVIAPILRTLSDGSGLHRAKPCREGAKHLLLNPVFDEMEQVELLASDVIPKL
jgi:hypothetical protein